MKIDASTISGGTAYHWMASTIVPRPIAWVSTLNGDGTANLAPFSFFTGASADPPTCIICVSRKSRAAAPPPTPTQLVAAAPPPTPTQLVAAAPPPTPTQLVAAARPPTPTQLVAAAPPPTPAQPQLVGASTAPGARDPLRVPDKKDTWANIERTGDYVINLVPDALAAIMNETSPEVPHGTDEFELAGVGKVASELVGPPRVAESPVAMEVRLHKIVEVGKAGAETAIIIGEILLWHVHDEILVNGRIDPDRLDAVARMGGSLYSRTRDRFELSRPKPVAPKP